MTRNVTNDRLSRFLQAGGDSLVRLVRIEGLDEGNRYRTKQVEFNSDGSTRTADDRVLVVTNLAEPAIAPGQLAAGTQAVALEVEGRWIIFVRETATSFPAKVLSSSGGSLYLVRRQVPAGEATFADMTDADDLTACNLAELSLGPGGAVDTGMIVQVTAMSDGGSPPATRYLFDHPAYAKYLD